MAKGIRRRLDVQWWRDALARHARCGQTVQRFCDEQGVSVGSFYRWRERVQDRSAVAVVATSASRVGDQVGQRAPQFVDLGTLGGGLPGAAAGAAQRLNLRIDLGGGLVLHLERV